MKVCIFNNKDEPEGRKASEITLEKTNNIYITYMWSLKNKQASQYNNKKQTHRFRGQTVVTLKGGKGGREDGIED